jgi:hypothetical protein
MTDWDVPVSPSHQRGFRRWGWLSGGFVVFCVITVFLFLGFGTRASVTVDLNPSLVLKINYFGDVIDIQAANEEGETFVQALGKRNGSMTLVFESIVETAQTLRYLNPEDPEPVLIGVSASSWDTEREVRESLESALSSLPVTLVCFSKHSASEDLLYSGLVKQTASGFSGWFPGIDKQESMTTTLTTTTAFTTTTIMTTTVFPSTTTAASFSGNYSTNTSPSIDSSNNLTTSPDDSRDMVELTETEFAEMQTRFGVSEAKLTMALLVFNAYDNYTLSSDLEFLCRLSVSELFALYQAIP